MDRDEHVEWDLETREVQEESSGPQNIRKSKCFGAEAVFHSRTRGDRHIVALAKNSLGKWATGFEADETI